MSKDSLPMDGVLVSEEEVARRKARVAAEFAQGTFPPLYRVAAMDPKALLSGRFGASHGGTRYIFAREDAERRPRLEIHTFAGGTVEVEASVLWRVNFESKSPEPPQQEVIIPVTLSGSSHGGRIFAASPEGWMAVVRTAEVVVLIIGPGELPSSLSLELVDLEALQESQSHPLAGDS